MIQSRPFKGEADYDLMRRLLVDVTARAGLPVYATVGDIDWWRSADEDPQAVYMAHLWFDNERPVAWAWPVTIRLTSSFTPTTPRSTTRPWHGPRMNIAVDRANFPTSRCAPGVLAVMQYVMLS